MKELDKFWKEVVTKGDKIALRKIYETYFDRLFPFALRILKSKQLAEEVISDVFVKIWQGRDSLSKVQNPETYLFIMVRNDSLKLIKRELKHTKGHLSILDENVFLAEENYIPDNQLFAEELREQIDSVIDQLPPACKNAFLLVKEDKLKYKEAAKVLKTSPFTVRNQVQKAVGRIRNFLESKAEHQAKVINFKNS